MRTRGGGSANLASDQNQLVNFVAVPGGFRGCVLKISALRTLLLFNCCFAFAALHMLFCNCCVASVVLLLLVFNGWFAVVGLQFVFCNCRFAIVVLQLL